MFWAWIRTGMLEVRSEFSVQVCKWHFTFVNSKMPSKTKCQKIFRGLCPWIRIPIPATSNHWHLSLWRSCLSLTWTSECSHSLCREAAGHIGSNTQDQHLFRFHAIASLTLAAVLVLFVGFSSISVSQGTSSSHTPFLRLLSLVAFHSSSVSTAGDQRAGGRKETLTLLLVWCLVLALAMAGESELQDFRSRKFEHQQQ